MVTAEAKTRCTKIMMEKEINGDHIDSQHSISVQYLQSLDYDHEMAPATGKMTVDGKEYNTYSVNDQVGLQDMLVPANKTEKKGGNTTDLPEMTRNKSRDETETPSFVELQHHRMQAGRKVILNGKVNRLKQGDLLWGPPEDDELDPPDPDAPEGGYPTTPPVDNSPAKGNRYDWYLWPFGEVPYTLHPTITPCGKSAFEAAVYEIEKFTCVRFKEVGYDAAKEVWENETKKAPLLAVTAENLGCFAGIGYKKEYQEHNVINIGSGCDYPGIILHLLLHNLGLGHEQARYDRDLFVNVLWENMISEEEFKEEREGELTGEFRVLKGTNSTWEETSEWLEYDYGSIMHFGRCEFSASPKEGIECEASLAALLSGGDKLMGNRQQMTAKDVTVVNSMYGCTDTCADGVQNQMETETDCGGPNCGDCDMPGYSKVSDACPLASAWNRHMEKPNAAAVVSLLALLLWQ
jgi:hypothetical protein